MRPAALSLSLNSLIALILAIMIFSSGVYFLTAVSGKVDAIQPPDYCPSRLQADIDDGMLFTLCPTQLTLTRAELKRGVKIQFAVVNPSPGEAEYTLSLDSPDSSFALLSPYTTRSLRVEPHASRVDVFTLRAGGVSGGVYHLPILLTDETNGGDYRRVITLTVK